MLPVDRIVTFVSQSDQSQFLLINMDLPPVSSRISNINADWPAEYEPLFAASVAYWWVGKRTLAFKCG
jgi:hypothetical protein